MKAKRLLCSIIAIAMILSTMSFSVFAESAYVAEVNGVGYASVNEAISNASAGDTVLINSAPGAFTIDKAITVKGADVSGTKVGLGDYQYITIADGIDGKVTIENIGFYGTTNQIIVFSGSDFSKLDFEIKDCYIEFNANRGIYVDKELKSLTVSGCTIDNISGSYAGTYAIWTNQYAPSKMNISNNKIIGNSFLRGAIHVGDYASNGAEITISDNEITGVERGVQVANQSDNVVINVKNNVFENIKQCIGSTKNEDECGVVFLHENATDSVEVNLVGNTASNSKAIIYNENAKATEEFVGSFVGNALNDTYIDIAGNAYVARIGNDYFKTFEEAVAAANAGDKLEIIADITNVATATVVLNDVDLVAAEGVSVTNNGVISIGGESTINLPNVSGETIDFLDGAVIVDSYINGGVFVAGNVTFRGDNTFAMLYDYGTLTDHYGTTANMEWTVEAGSSVKLTNTARYGLGYGDNITVNGNISNALTARDTLTDDDLSLFMHGLVGQESKGWNCNSALTINNAYVKIGSNNSFGNKPGNYGGTYTYSITNSVVDASRITFYEALSTTTFNITNSDVKMGTFMTNDADSVFNLKDSVVLSTTTANGSDEGNYNAGKLNIYNTKLTYSAPVRNNGEITIDVNSKLTAPSVTGTGVITIDAKDYDGYSELSLFYADMTGFTGTYNVINNDFAKVVIDTNGNVILSSDPVGGPITAFTSENSIWGETRGNAKESYVVKVYSEDTYMGEAKLVDVNGDLIDGDVTVLWNIPLNGIADEYWDVTWAINPSMDYQPTHVELWIDGAAVSRGKVQLNAPDDLNKICAAVTDANGKILSYATSLQNAFSKVENGGRIELLRDVELDKSVNYSKNIAFTFDGNGKTVKNSNKYTDSIALFDISNGADITFENIIFDGVKKVAIMRTVYADVTVDNCVIQNCNHTVDQGLLRLLGDATITNSKFINNNCSFVITMCYDDSNNDEVFLIDNCVFENNTSDTATVYYTDGLECTVTNSEFIGNNVTASGNAATLYMGFNGGSIVKGNLFKDNTVTTSSSSMRVAGAVFAGFKDDNCEISGNAFVNNTATANGNVAASGVAYSAYYGAANLDGNYWDGNEPVSGVDFTYEYPNSNDLTVEKYYREYSIDANGNVVLADLKPIVSKVVAVQFVENVLESDADNGIAVYDIVIVAKDEHIINRLNTADLTFEQSSDNIVYEVIAAEDITLTHNTDYPDRYMFNFDGKTDVEDTDVALTIGKVRFTGYDTFTFKLAYATSNLVTATTLDDNIVSYYAADGLVLNDDIDGDGKYLGYVNTTIAVPTRTLKVTIDFPNAVKDNVIGYQNMKVEITGVIEGVNQTVTYNLGTDEVVMGTDGSYVVTEGRLVLNNAYTVTVSGAGYRTARYTVTMTDSKELKFWNNVMDEAQVVEIGKDSSAVKVTYLAGDIVKDNKINIYDLSAVVSYFGSASTIANGYVKYDLNRDGVIDSKDVAYVLVSWGN